MQTTSSPLMRRGRLGRMLWDENDEPEMDTAGIRVCNGLNVPIEVFGQVTECADCPLESLSGPIEPDSNSTILTLTTNYRYRLEVRPDNAHEHPDYPDYPDDYYDDYKKPKHTFVSCSLDYHFDEYGQYTWNVGGHSSCGSPALGNGDYDYYANKGPRDFDSNTTTIEPPRQMNCTLDVISDGYPTYLPILVYGVGVLLMLPLIWLVLAVINSVLRLKAPKVYKFMWDVMRYLAAPKTFRTQRSSAPAQPQSEQIESPAATSADEATSADALSNKEGAENSRIVCVDVIRGIAISIMIFGTAFAIMA